jgi:hypothetical protein
MKRQNFDASTYTKHVRQLANAKLYQTDTASGVPQNERKSIVSNAPLANSATNVLLQEFFPGSSLLAVELPITGALVFDGSSTLSASAADMNVGSVDYTIELYVYNGTIPNDSYPRYFNIGSIRLSQQTDNTSTTTMYLEAPGISIIPVSSGVPKEDFENKWTHIALVRASGVTRLYIDGINVGGTTSAYTGVNGNVVIGNGSGSENFIGRITQFRLTVGSAVYTTNFVRPIVQLKAVLGTQLLLNVKSPESRLADSARGRTVTVASGAVPYTLIVPPIY